MVNRLNRLLAVIVIVLLCPGIAPAQKKQNAAEILKNIEQTLADVKDYTVELQADVNMERMRMPKMMATMYFKRPDKIDFKSESFVMLPREGITLDPALLRARYDATLIGEEQIGEMKTHKLQLAAKETKTRLRQMFLWVDPSNWTIIKMETIPYQGRVLTALFTYALQEGKYWLPQTLKISFEASGRDTTTRRTEPDVASSPSLEEMQRPPRSGNITVSYSNYKVNVGLTDEFFKKKDRPGK